LGTALSYPLVGSEKAISMCTLWCRTCHCSSNRYFAYSGFGGLASKFFIFSVSFVICLPSCTLFVLEDGLHQFGKITKFCAYSIPYTHRFFPRIPSTLYAHNNNFACVRFDSLCAFSMYAEIILAYSPLTLKFCLQECLILCNLHMRIDFLAHFS